MFIVSGYRGNLYKIISKCRKWITGVSRSMEEGVIINLFYLRKQNSDNSLDFSSISFSPLNENFFMAEEWCT